jgi:hypothetical protein
MFNIYWVPIVTFQKRQGDRENGNEPYCGKITFQKEEKDRKDGNESYCNKIIENFKSFNLQASLVLKTKNK